MNNQKNGKPSVTGVLLAAFMFIVTLLPVPAFAAGNLITGQEHDRISSLQNTYM